MTTKPPSVDAEHGGILRGVPPRIGLFSSLAIGVLYVLVAIGVSCCFWDDLHGQGYPASVTIRNLVLIWGAPLATVLAVWRSIVAQRQSEAAQRQAEVAQRGLLSGRYQRAVEMLGHDLVSVRIGGIHALRNLALEHYDEYQREVLELLEAYRQNPKHRDGTGENTKVTVAGKKNKETTYQPDEWEAQQAFDVISSHRKHIRQGEPVRRWWRE